MNKYLFKLIVIGFLQLGSLAAAAERIEKTIHISKTRTMAISANPLQALFLTGSVKYGVRLADFVALTIPLQFTFVDSAFSDQSATYWWLESGLGARFFLTGKAFESGVYIEPELKFGYSRFSDGGMSIFSVSPGVMAGYSWVFDSGFLINLGGGLSYNFKIADRRSSLPARFRYPWPILDFSLGYAW